MKNLKLLLFTSFCSLFLAGCWNNNPQPTFQSNSDDEIFGTHMFVEKCYPDNDSEEEKKSSSLNEHGEKSFGTAAAAIIIPAIIEESFDVFAGFVEKWGADKPIDTTLIGNVLSLKDIRETANNRVCLKVVRAVIKEADENSTITFKNTLFNKKPFGEYAYVEGTLEMYAEFVIDIKENNFLIAPVVLKYSGNRQLDDINDEKARDLSFTIGYSAPSKDATAENGLTGSRLINFGTVKASREKPLILNYLLDDKPTLLNHAQWLPIDKSILKGPFSFVVKIVETKKAGEFQKILANAFEKNKDKLKTSITDAVSALDILKTDAEIKQLKITQMEADITAYSNYHTAVIVVETAAEDLMNCASLSTSKIKTKQLVLSIAQQKVNKIVASTGKGKSYLPIQVVDGVCTQ